MANLQIAGKLLHCDIIHTRHQLTSHRYQSSAYQKQFIMSLDLTFPSVMSREHNEQLKRIAASRNCIASVEDEDDPDQVKTYASLRRGELSNLIILRVSDADV